MNTATMKINPGKTSAVPEWYASFEAELVPICAPTLAGFKSASIFSVRPTDPEYIRLKVEYWDQKLSKFGVRVTILKDGTSPRPTIIYVYRPHQVMADLNKAGVRDFLGRYGYDPDLSLEECLDVLRERLLKGNEFPHEIGIFIGYPLEDVVPFVENKDRSGCCMGLWCAYCDQEEKEKFFNHCKRCSSIYTHLFHQGRPVEQMVVAC